MGICVRRILKSSNNPHLSVSLESAVAVRHSKKPGLTDDGMLKNYTGRERERLPGEIISVGQTIRGFSRRLHFSLPSALHLEFLHSHAISSSAVPFAILPKLLLCLTLRFAPTSPAFPALLPPGSRSLPPCHFQSLPLLHSPFLLLPPHPSREPNTSIKVRLLLGRLSGTLSNRKHQEGDQSDLEHASCQGPRPKPREKPGSQAVELE